jgi:hypothetical protein
LIARDRQAAFDPREFSAEHAIASGLGTTLALELVAIH